MPALIDVTLKKLAISVGQLLPSRWPIDLGDPTDGNPKLPNNPSSLYWTIGDWSLVVVVDEESDQLMTTQEGSMQSALSGSIENAAQALTAISESGEIELSEAKTVADIDDLLTNLDGDSRSITLMDDEIHRATIIIRLKVTDAMLEDVPDDSQPDTNEDTSGGGGGGVTAGVPAQGGVGQQAAQGGNPNARQGQGMQGQGFGRAPQGGGQIIGAVNPNDLPSALGRSPGESPMMPHDAVASPAEFTAFDDYGNLGGMPHPLALLGDVELGVTAELGRTRLTVKSVLGLTPGSIIELDRAAGAPVDVVVNGTLIARGEVVVIDEEFGVRITQIMGMPDLAQASAQEIVQENT